MSKKTYRYVFVFTYGRSGSTLLMGFLNRLPGFCIRGENYMALAHLYRFHRAAENMTRQRAKTSDQPTHPWYGVDLIDASELRRKLRILFTDSILQPGPDSRVLGFKEIRIQRKDIPDLDDFLAWLEETFVDVKFIFNHRRISDTAKSKWWRDTPHSHAIIHGMDRRLRESRFAAARNVFHVQYEDFVSDPSHAADLAKFVGAQFDEDAYRQVLATSHSY